MFDLLWIIEILTELRKAGQLSYAECYNLQLSLFFT